MNYQGEVSIAASQMQVWEVLGNLARLPEWIDSQCLYLPPQTMERIEGDGLNSLWRMTVADEQVATWQVFGYEPGFSLGLGLTGIEGSPLNIAQYYHVFSVTVQSVTETIVSWDICFRLGHNGLKQWAQNIWLAHMLNEQFEWMLEYSLKNLKNLIEGIYVEKPSLEDLEDEMEGI